MEKCNISAEIVKDQLMQEYLTHSTNVNKSVELRQSVPSLEVCVTECTQAENKLLKSEKQYCEPWKSAPIPCLSVSVHNGSIISCNAAAVRLLGYDRGTMRRMKNFDIYADTPHGRSRAQEVFTRLKAGESIKDVELQMKHKNGNSIWVRLSVEAVIGLNGNVIAGRAVVINISKRKRAEEKLIASERKYRELIDLLPQTVFESDKKGNVTFVNCHGLKAFGYTQKDFDKGLNTIQLTIAEDRDRAEEDLRRVLNGEDLNGSEYKCLRKDGSIFPVVLYPSPIVCEGTIEGVRGIAIDITKRKMAEQALKERERELEIKAKTLEDVNTALRVLLKRIEEDKIELEEKVLSNVKDLVVPFLERLKASSLDAKQTAYVSVIESNLDNVISSFSRNMTYKYSRFTPTQIQIANLISEGKATKEIAEILNLSGRTVDNHRLRIRKKVGINNKKANLRSHLLSFQ